MKTGTDYPPLFNNFTKKFFISTPTAKVAGILISVIRVAKAKPDERESAIGCTNGSEPPHPYAVGNNPTMVVVAVRRTARKRRRPAVMIA